MILNRESYFWIEAMEDSSVILINYKNWRKLVKNHGCWDSLLKVFLEKVFIKKENREKEFLLDNAETRYKNFLREYPKLEQRIKQHHIASYLGITPVALSRIRNKFINLG
jgi:CRP-like cAMP-binding protein